MPPKLTLAVPPHPAVRQSLTFFSLAVLMLGGGVSTLMGPGGWVTGPVLLAFSGLLLWLGLFVRRSGPAAQTINFALNRLLAGQIADAEARFIAADAQFSLGYIRRIIALNRAWIALRRGEL